MHRLIFIVYPGNRLFHSGPEILCCFRRIIKSAITLTLCLTTFFVHGQDLVGNGDFELYNACPTAIGGLAYSAAFTSFPTVQNWVNPIATTSDYFNACSAPTTNASVPSNLGGYQMAQSGNAYVGMHAYTGGYREYVMTKLLKPMQKDSVYCVRFYISPGGSSAITNAYDKMTSVHAFGAHFSDTIPALSSVPALNLPFHVLNDSNVVLTDTGKWHEVRGMYKATSAVQYMTIGCFGSNAAPPTITVLYGTGSRSGACYMLVDNVSVEPARVDDSSYLITLCDSDLVLTSRAAKGPYLWSTGDTGRSIRGYTVGIFKCESLADCNVVRDSFNVLPLPVTQLLHDTALCDLKTVTVKLKASFDGGTYDWGNGNKQQSVSITDTGTYICRTIKDCRLYVEQFKVRYPVLIPPLVHDTTICQGVTLPKIRVDDTAGLLWHLQAQGLSMSQTQPNINTSQPGRITLYVSRKDGQCASTRVPVVVTVAERVENAAPDSTIRCRDIYDRSEKLGTSVPNAISYTWTNGATDCCIDQPSNDGIYVRTTEIMCGPKVDTFIVTSRSCDHCIFLPDAFTPNGDSRNDRFRPIIQCAATGFNMRVFNRWGNAVYISEDKEGFWDGTRDGIPEPAGVYMYYVSFKNPMTGTLVFKKGEVTLIR